MPTAKECEELTDPDKCEWEWTTKDGVNGYIVKQKDSADLIEKIEKFLSLGREEQAKMGLAGRAKVEREFDRRIVIRKYLDEICSENSPKSNI